MNLSVLLALCLACLSSGFLFSKKCPLKTIKPNAIRYMQIKGDIRVAPRTYDKLKQLAPSLKRCNIKLELNSGFQKTLNQYLDPDVEEVKHLLVGNAVKMTVKDNNGQVLCNEVCLKKSYTPPLISSKLTCLDTSLQQLGLKRYQNLIYDPYMHLKAHNFNQKNEELKKSCA
ncbi:hypothetical protein ACOME3_010400 [Neoechinorhynchus agilis]